MDTETVSWWRTNFGEDEIRRVVEAIQQEHLSMGPVTAEFERCVAETIDVSYFVATTSGSMAILMALIAAGVGPGDEVIVPNRTWIATAHAPLLLGANPVLIDVRSVNMREVTRIADRNGVIVVEDAAQAFGSRNADGWIGTQSFARCFSLSIAKISFHEPGWICRDAGRKSSIAGSNRCGHMASAT